MAFIKSIFIGSEGSYNVCGIDVIFANHEALENDIENPSVKDSSEDPNAAHAQMEQNRFFNSRLYCFISQATLHSFVHEMGHALAYKLLLTVDPKIEIFKRISFGCSAGRTSAMIPTSLSKASWKLTLINLSGPFVSIAFSTSKIVAANLLENSLPRPITLTLKIGAGLSIVHEALGSTLVKNDGDFRKIRQRSSLHLTFAIFLLISQCSLATLVLMKKV